MVSILFEVVVDGEGLFGVGAGCSSVDVMSGGFGVAERSVLGVLGES